MKPTVGLISRSGIVPIAASQDTAGPIARTVTDTAILLGAMTGVDGRDPATVSSIGNALTDYTPFLKADALAGARLGIARQYWNNVNAETNVLGNRAFDVMRSLGAEVFDITIGSFAELNAFSSSVLSYEFKRDLNAYLATRGPSTPVRTLADVIAYNSAHPQAALKYGQVLAVASQALDLYGAEPQHVADRATDLRLAKVQGIDAAMDQNNLTAIVFPSNVGAGIAAKAGYPSVIVPAGYLANSAPFGITFTGKAYSEGTLLGVAYAFEQATKYRQPPGSALRLLPLSTSVRISEVLNYASGAGGPVAPGETVAIKGTGLGPAQAAGPVLKPNNQIDTVAAGTRVLFDGIPAPILGASSSEVLAIVPYGVAGKTSVQVYAEAGGQRSSSVPVPVTDATPAIFKQVLNADGAMNSASNPARKGSTITFFATGEGVLSTLPVDGRLPAAPYQTPLLPVVVGVNDAGIIVLYAGATPRYPGQLQVNAQLAADTPAGAARLVLAVGDKYSPPATIYVQ